MTQWLSECHSVQVGTELWVKVQVKCHLFLEDSTQEAFPNPPVGVHVCVFICELLEGRAHSLFDFCIASNTYSSICVFHVSIEVT